MLLIKGAVRTPRVPKDVARSLAMLLPARWEFAATSHAAMALYAFHTRADPGPGIQLPSLDYRARTHLRPDINSPSFEVLAPGRPMSYRALLFHDQSVLVLRISHLPGQPAEALPVVFRLPRVARDGLPILHVSNPERSDISAHIGFKDHARDPAPPSFSEVQVEASDALYTHPCLKALRADLRRLAPLFETMPWIVEPRFGPLPEGPIDARTAEALNLPVTAVGAELAWPDALPFQLIDRQDRAAIQSYLAEYATWVVSAYPEGSHASASLELDKPHALPGAWGPITVTVSRAHPAPGQVRTPSFSPGFLMAEPERFKLPVPQERLTGFTWDTSGQARRQRVRAIRLPAARSEMPSNHDRLRLAGLFGAPRPDGLA